MNMASIGRDLSEFKVGMQRSFSRRFSAEDTWLIGELTGDHNPFHYDGEFIRNTRFKKPIVHGLLIGGMICHFGGDIFPGPGFLAEEMEFKFLKPVFFDEEVTAIGTVTAVDQDRRRITFSMEVYNGNEELVLSGTVVGIPFKVEISE
jgi:3-hydroxybutyryl-CoA dehydratase